MMLATEEPRLCLPPRPLGRSPRAVLPPGTIDSHFHVFEAGAPLATPRSYTPRIVTIDDWVALADAMGIAKGVLVQPSVYGFDNSVLLRALAAHPDRLRGIVVIAPDTPQADLERMDRIGVRGVRINTRNKGGLSFDAVKTLAKRVKPFGWSLQFQINPVQMRDVAAISRQLGPVVIDHLGFIPLAEPEASGLLHDLQTLLDAGDCHVKISAPYRLTTDPTHSAFGAAVKSLAKSHPERLLWATDWPHTEIWDNVPDDADLIDAARDWLGDDQTRRQVFVLTPEKLFFSR